MAPPKKKSRDALLKAAAEVLSRNPGARLADIAEKAGIGRATLHRYFPTRKELVCALARASIDEIDAASAKIPFHELSAAEGLRRSLAAILPVGDHYGFLASEPETLQDPDIRRDLDRQLDELRQMVEALKLEGAIGLDVPTAWVVATIDSLIYTAWSSVHRGDVARNDAAELVVRTVLRGLGPSTPGAGP